jgi:hypothetical protein
MSLRCFERAVDLPISWEERVRTADHPFLMPSFLNFLEETNPCDQRYYFDEESGLLFVTYRLKLDFFTYTSGFAPKIRIRVLGIPLSVSKEGFLLPSSGETGPLLRALDAIGGGLTLLLNVPGDQQLPLPAGRTLPSHVLPLTYGSVESYHGALRSHYRRRLKAILRAGSDFSERPAKAGEHARVLYPLYRSVFDRSEAKLECLDPGYFDAFPGETHVITREDHPVAFYQTLESQRTLYFVLGGFNREEADPNVLYPYLLHRLIQRGIGSDRELLDLGQTADESKARTGARPEEKRLYLHHRFPWVRRLLRLVVPLFGYRAKERSHHVFKECDDPEHP